MRESNIRHKAVSSLTSVWNLSVWIETSAYHLFLSLLSFPERLKKCQFFVYLSVGNQLILKIQIRKIKSLSLCEKQITDSLAKTNIIVKMVQRTNNYISWNLYEENCFLDTGKEMRKIKSSTSNNTSKKVILDSTAFAQEAKIV